MARFDNPARYDFSEMYANGTFVDLKIFCDGDGDSDDSKFFNVHRVVMAAASPFLKSVILDSAPTDSSLPDAITLNFKANIVSSVLDFLYNGTVVVPEENQNEIWKCGKVLQIPGLQEPVKAVKDEPIASTSKALPKREPENIKAEQMETEHESETEDSKPQVKPNKIKTEGGISEDAAKFTKQPDGKVVCLLCLKSFNFIRNAKVHYKEKHIGSTEVFKCKYCQQDFKFKRCLNQHLLKVHKITQRMLKQAIG